MITLRLPARVFLCLAATDMRKSFDSLAALVTATMAADPLSGDLFVFRGKRGDRLKMLYFDGDGYALWYKRLEEGTFRFPEPLPVTSKQGDAGLAIRAAELVMLLDGVDLASVQRQKRYQRPAATPAAVSA